MLGLPLQMGCLAGWKAVAPSRLRQHAPHVAVAGLSEVCRNRMTSGKTRAAKGIISEKTAPERLIAARISCSPDVPIGGCQKSTMCVKRTAVCAHSVIFTLHPPDEVSVDRRLAPEPEPACRQPAARARSQKNSGIVSPIKTTMAKTLAPTSLHFELQGPRDRPQVERETPPANLWFTGLDGSDGRRAAPGRRWTLSATVADASDGAPCCQLAPCIVARHRR